MVQRTPVSNLHISLRQPMFDMIDADQISAYYLPATPKEALSHPLELQPEDGVAYYVLLDWIAVF